MLGRLKKHITAQGSDPDNLVAAITAGHNATYSLLQARRILHALGEGPLPALPSLLPDVYFPFIHRQVALSLTFVPLHEQAHLEFYQEGRVPELEAGFEQRIIIESLTQNKNEEYAADSWAVEQFSGKAAVIMTRAGLLFLD